MIDKNDTCGYKLESIKLVTMCCDFEFLIPQDCIKILSLSNIMENEYFDNYGELISSKTIGDFKLVLNEKAKKLKIDNPKNKDLFKLLSEDYKDDLMSIEIKVKNNKNKINIYKYMFIYEVAKDCDVAANICQKVLYNKDNETLTITISPDNIFKM